MLVHRRVRLELCRARSKRNCTDWGRIVFSDEYVSNCVLTMTAGVSWDILNRGRGTCPDYRKPHRPTTRSYGLWGGVISFDNRTYLVIIFATVTSQLYEDDILKPVMLPFLLQHTGLTFQHDNARPRLSKHSSAQSTWPKSKQPTGLARRACSILQTSDFASLQWSFSKQTSFASSY